MDCQYMDKLLKVAAELAPKGKMTNVTIKHDDWCPVIGGDGSKRCLPVIFFDGKMVATDYEDTIQ